MYLFELLYLNMLRLVLDITLKLLVLWAITKCCTMIRWSSGCAVRGFSTLVQFIYYFDLV